MPCTFLVVFQLEELPVAHEMIRRLEQKVENLEAVIKIRSDYERFISTFLGL